MIKKFKNIIIKYLYINAYKFNNNNKIDKDDFNCHRYRRCKIVKFPRQGKNLKIFVVPSSTPI